MPRIVVIGAPRTGKSTYATKLARQLGVHLASTGKRTDMPESLVSTDNYIKRGSFEEVPGLIIKDLRGRKDFVLEGTQAARVLRRWYRDEKDDPQIDKVIFVGNRPWVTHNKGQAAMGKAVRTVFREVEPMLRAAGVPVEHMSLPEMSEAEWREYRQEKLDESTDSLPTTETEPEADPDLPE